MKRFSWPTVALLVGLAWLAACSTPPVARPTWPSVVVTEEGVQYYVSNLKLPGTRQELRARRGEGNLWIPLREMASLRFTGILHPDDYRRARVVLRSGEVLEVELYTRGLIEGDTDAGYWNLPLSRVAAIEFGGS
ncbi:MAG: hypothetical protein K6T55_09375 [Syntrophobacterales bacterium]|nr:hypothetical protein [Syntrophobacterales bacterium]